MERRVSRGVGRVSRTPTEQTLSRNRSPASKAKGTAISAGPAPRQQPTSSPLLFMAVCTPKAKTTLAEETGRIAKYAQRRVELSDKWPLRAVKETPLDFSIGEEPRWIRYQFTPPIQSEYAPFMATGNENRSFSDPNNPGTTITALADKTGKGCNLPADTLHSGYDTFGRCVRGKAWETDPICLWDLATKEQAAAYIAGLRDSMPAYGEQQFADELLRQVDRLSKYKYSIAPGFPVSTNSASFPTVPTGGLDIDFLELVANNMRREMEVGAPGGNMRNKDGGRPRIEVYAGYHDIQWAVRQIKIKYGYEVKSEPYSDDGRITMRYQYGDFVFIVNPTPPKGYLVNDGNGTMKFVELPKTTTRAGTGEGIVSDPNYMLDQPYVNVGGTTYDVVTKSYIIFDGALERQARATAPTIGGKTVKGKFNFEVTMVDPWAILADPRCNKDDLWIQYRCRHIYAPFSMWPECMTSIMHLAATPSYTPVNPHGAYILASATPVSNQPFAAPPQGGCVPCDPGPVLRDAAPSTCTNVFPANGVGVFQMDALTRTVEEGNGIIIRVNRTGGQTGAASVNYATANGTATAGTEYTAASGTLNWADQEFGTKTFTVTTISTGGDDSGKTFTATISSPTGATLGTPATTTVTLTDADQA